MLFFGDVHQSASGYRFQAIAWPAQRMSDPAYGAAIQKMRDRTWWMILHVTFFYNCSFLVCSMTNKKRPSGRLNPSPIWYSSRPTSLSSLQINPSINHISRAIQFSPPTISSSLSPTPSTWVTPSTWPIRWWWSSPSTRPTWYSRRPKHDIL